MSKNDRTRKSAAADAQAAEEPASQAEPVDSEASEALPEEGSLEVLQNDLEKFRDLALRSQADLENFRKRATREKTDAIKYANAGLLERLLPVIDNFELGLEAARTDRSQSATLDGMEMVFKQIQDFLRDAGVEVIDAAGTEFDPNLHEAVAQEESSEVEEGYVLRQIRKGFKLQDRLLRPANVIVAKRPSQED